MTELTRGEMEKHHFREVANNPFYAAEGMMDVRLEEFAENINMLPKSVEPIKQEPWNRKQWDVVNQFRGELLYFKNKVVALEEKTPLKRKSKY